MDGRPSFSTNVFRAQPDDSVHRKIQKRNRPPVSCLLCRSRKVKCDRQQPCERCVKSGEANFCEYAPRAARRSRPEARQQQDRSKAAEVASRPVLQSRLQKLEEMVNGLVVSLPGSGPPRDQHFDTPSSSDMRNDTDSRSDLSSPPSLGPPPHGGPLLTTTQVGDQAYVGGSHWAAILDSIHDMQGLLENEPEVRTSPSPPPSESAGPELIFGSTSTINHEQAVARLPPKSRTDQLILMYFRSRFSVQPYIHTSKFQREYDGFWVDPSSVSLLWISCLASMMLIALSLQEVKGEPMGDPSDPAHPDNLALLASQCLAGGNYLAGQQKYSLEAFMMHAYTQLKRTKEIDTSLWAKFGILARMAQRMGYHRDPKYLKNISPFDGELRRRLWFFIEVFDVIFSFQLGMPPIIRDDECDTESPGNYYDSDFDENSEVLPPPRPVTEPTALLYLCCKSRICRFLRRVIRSSMLIDPPPYDQVLKLDMEIRAYHDAMPPSLQIRPVRSYSFTDEVFDIIHRLILEVMYLKSLCVLHRPYLSRDKNNPRYDVSRSRCVDAALKILDLHVEYEEQCRPGGRLFDDKYLLAQLTLHDFLIASMILCLDLMENFPTSPAERSRKLKALGSSYNMWSERKHSSKDAAHATRIVGAILKKVSMRDQSTSMGHMQLPPPTPPPQKPEVRGPSLASIMNSEPQKPPALEMFENAGTRMGHGFDFTLDFSDMISLDKFIGDPAAVDWNAIDQLLLNSPGAAAEDPCHNPSGFV